MEHRHRFYCNDCGKPATNKIRSYGGFQPDEIIICLACIPNISYINSYLAVSSDSAKEWANMNGSFIMSREANSRSQHPSRWNYPYSRSHKQ